MTTSIRNSDISNLEAKVKQEDSMDDTDDVMSGRVVLRNKETTTLKKRNGRNK